MYHIDPATPSDVPLLPAIEERASALFGGIAALAAIPPHSVSMQELDAAQRAGLLWVARDPEGVPIGFALVEPLADGLHLEEVDVLPECGRQGVGRALVTTVCEYARARGTALTLCTFRDVPWNAPFYARIGFRELAPHELWPAIAERVREEEARGLERRLRVVMKCSMPSPPATVANKTNAEHYVWGDVCEGWRLLSRPDLSVIQERIPAGHGEVMHYHERARQLFYVLQGELDIEVASATSRLHPGDSLEVPPREPHRVWNASESDAVFLVISAPTTSGDRVNLA